MCLSELGAFSRLNSEPARFMAHAHGQIWRPWLACLHQRHGLAVRAIKRPLGRGKYGCPNLSNRTQKHYKIVATLIDWSTGCLVKGR